MIRCRLALFLISSLPVLGQTRAAAVFIDGSVSQVLLNDTLPLTAAAYDSNGNRIASAQFTWTVSDKTVFTIDSTGAVKAIGLGWADITAATTGASGNLRLQSIPSGIVVKPADMTVTAGDTVQYSADVLDKNGVPISGQNIQWRAFGPQAGQDQYISVDANGLVTTSGCGTFYVEAYFNYTVGAGPFLQRAYGNTTLTCVLRKTYQSQKLLDGTPVRQSFELRPRRGAMSVNDSGQIAYVGSLEGITTAPLLWDGSAFSAYAVGGQPAEFPGSALLDVNTPALNNNGEIAASCSTTFRNCLFFGSPAAGATHALLFDGATAGGVSNVRNYSLTRFSLNDSSTILFRADYWPYGSTVTQTGIFTANPSGATVLVLQAGTPLPGISGSYTFNSDFGIANDGSILFSVASGSSNTLYRMGPDQSIARVIGTGDTLNGSTVASISSVAVGKNGHFTVMANIGTAQIILLSSGDPTKFRQLSVNSFSGLYAISGAGEVVMYCSVGLGYGLHRWDGTTSRPVALTGLPSPIGDPYTQFDSAGVTAAGDVIVQARTANNLLLVVNAGAGLGAKASVVFQTGAPVNVPAGPSFSNLVMNGHSGNPMIKAGQYMPNVLEVAGGVLTPRLVGGDRTPNGWFYEGNQDVRRDGDGDLLVSTDESVSLIADQATLLAHFPYHTLSGNLNTGFQVVGTAKGTAVIAGGTSFGVQHLSIIQNGTLTTLAWLGANGSIKTTAPGGGNFTGSNDIGIADDGTIYASLRVSTGNDGIFAWDGTAWKSLLRIGDTYDGFKVTSIGTIRVAGKALYAFINATFQHLVRYQNGKWTDIINQGDLVPAGGAVNGGFGTFDVNRNGALAAILSAGGVQYVVTVDDSNGMRTVADNNHPMDTGEMLANFFQVSIHDDGRIFVTAINSQEALVLYECDPIH